MTLLEVVGNVCAFVCVCVGAGVCRPRFISDGSQLLRQSKNGDVSSG